jgi:hypothetical protein
VGEEWERSGRGVGEEWERSGRGVGEEWERSGRGVGEEWEKWERGEEIIKTKKGLGRRITPVSHCRHTNSIRYVTFSCTIPSAIINGNSVARTGTCMC